MLDDNKFEDINEAKANMDHIYDQNDPRAYFCELKKLGYVIPGVAKPIFRQLIAHLQDRQDRAVRVLDLGCSYGVNAALLKHDLSMPDLYDHWGREALLDVPSEQVIAEDRRFFADLGDAEDIKVIGLDQAEAAVAFGESAGLLDEGLAVNLETEPLPATATEELALVDLVTSTGCVGYVTERSFERLLPAVMQGQPPWIGNFVLRMFPFDAIETSLEGAGYNPPPCVTPQFRDVPCSDPFAPWINELSARGITAGCGGGDYCPSSPVRRDHMSAFLVSTFFSF